MDATLSETFRSAILVIGICIGASVVTAIVLIIVAVRQIANIDVPEDADFFETLQHVPITVPLALDLLDLAFDFFAAPISWVILELMGLRALQMVTVFESLIPGTQLIPTMTIAWVISRTVRKRKTELRSALKDYQDAQYQSRYGRLRSSRAASIGDRYRRRALPAPYDQAIEGEYFEEDLDEPAPYFFDDEEEQWR